MEDIPFMEWEQREEENVHLRAGGMDKSSMRFNPLLDVWLEQQWRRVHVFQRTWLFVPAWFPELDCVSQMLVGRNIKYEFKT